MTEDEAERRIKALEEDFRHEKEMRRLHSERLAAHDNSLIGIRETLADIGRTLARTNETLDRVAIMTERNAGLVRELISAIIEGRSNGGQQ